MSYFDALLARCDDLNVAGQDYPTMHRVKHEWILKVFMLLTRNSIALFMLLIELDFNFCRL